MYNKPAPFNIGSPEQLAESVGYSKQALAKIMQNPGSGVDQTLAVLAGMYIDRMKTGGQMAQMPTTTVKDDVLAGLEQASIPEDMFSSGVGEVMPTKNMAAGGLVAFADGGEVDDWKPPVFNPELAEAWKRAKTQRERDNIVAEDRARIEKETAPRGLTKRTASNPALSRGQSDNPSRATEAFQSKYNPRVGMVPSREAPKAGLEAITPQVDSKREYLDGSHFTKGPPPYAVPDEEAVSDLPPISGPGSAGGGGASMGVGYRGGKPNVNLNTDIEKEARNIRDTYDKLYPKSEEEKKNAEYYNDENVASREAAQKKTDMWQALMELGFGAAASKSPYWTQAWGESGEKMAPHVSAMLKARKDEKDAIQKARQAMAQADRARNDDEYKLAVQNVRQAQELQLRAELQQEEIRANVAMTNARIAASNKPSRDEKYVDYLAKQMIADGMDPTQAYAKASREVMRYTSGIEKYEQTQTKMTKDQATKAWTKDISYDREYRRIKKAEGQAAADAYKAGVINSLMNGGSDDMDTTASDGAWGELNIR